MNWIEKEERCKQIAQYVIEKKSTVRQAGKKFGMSKSTVHNYITDMLKTVDSGVAEEVRKVLETNKKERGKRGGMAIKRKYEILKSKK